MTFLKSKKLGAGLQMFGRAVASIRLTVGLLFVLIPVSVLGTLIPQGREYSEYIQRFGPKLTDILYVLQFNSVFKSPLFLLLVFVLGVNILGCFIISLIQGKRSWGFILIHLSLVLLIAGGWVSAFARIRGSVTIQEGETIASFTSDGKIIPLGFELRLKKFELQKYEIRQDKLLITVRGRSTPCEVQLKMQTWMPIPGSLYQFQVERYVADFRYDMGQHAVFSASEEANNPAILVHVKGAKEDYSDWIFARHADFHEKKDRPVQLKYVWAPDIPKDFISHMELLEGGRVVRAQAVRVNHPLRYKGFGVFQSSYDPQGGKWSGLEIVRDPGVGLIYFSILLILLGLIQNIYLRPGLWKGKNKEKR